MRIDSRLMKTEIEVHAIERREDRLLMESPPDDWNETKVYLSPKDVIQTLRISLHRDMLVYLLLFPFFLISHYLQGDDDIEETVLDIGFFAAAIFVALLLLGGSSFLLARPQAGAIVLGILAGLFLFTTIGGRKPGFLYLSAPLAVIAMFLLALAQGVSAVSFPWVAAALVLTLMILAKTLGDERLAAYANALTRTGYLLVLVFAIYLGANFATYAAERAWAGSLPLLAFSIFLFVRYLDTREVLLHYAAMTLFAAGAVLALYGIPFLPVAYYGLPLVALSMAMVLIADRYHEAHGLSHVAPTYSVAIVLALLAFAYAWLDLSALILTLALFSVHFFGGTRSLGDKSTAGNLGEQVFQWIEFALANLAAGIATLLMLTVGLANWASPIASAVYVYFYIKMGFGREPTMLQSRNQYLWAAGGFYAVLVFVLLGLFDPLRGTQNDMLLVPALLLPLLLFGAVLQRRGADGPAASIFEGSLLTVAVALLLPTVLGDFYLPTASVVAGLLTALYLLFGLLLRNETLFYALPFLAAHLYFNFLTSQAIPTPSLGLLYVPPALLAMGLALLLRRRGRGPSRTFYITWFIFSGASVLGTAPHTEVTVPLIAAWAALYLLAAALPDATEEAVPAVETGVNV